MEALVRRALGGTFDALATSGTAKTSRHILARNKALGRQAWTREVSTKTGSARVSAPWHHRIAQLEARGNPRFTSHLRWRPSPKRSFHSFKPRRSQGPAAEGKDSTPEASLSISQRLKKLSREYGWSAVGVYLGFSVLDFPFCFLLVRTIGTDKIAEAEHYVVSNIKKIIPEGIKQWWHDYRSALKKASNERLGEEATKDVEMAGWGVAEAEEKNQAEASKSCFPTASSFSPELPYFELPGLGVNRVVNFLRSRHATSSRVRHPQKLHFRPGSPDGRYHAQGCQGSQVLGLADRQEAFEGAEQGTEGCQGCQGVIPGEPRFRGSPQAGSVNFVFLYQLHIDCITVP